MNGLPVFKFQVAGSHSSSSSNLLLGESGRVLKPYKVKANSPLRACSPDQIQPNKEAHNTENENFDGHEVVCPDERAFYELCSREEVPLRQLRTFLPAFYGDVTVCTAGRPTRYLVLEDLTARCGLPCVADLKMGVSWHYPGKPSRKLRADKEKYPSLRDTGWCIAGLLQHAPHGALLEKFGPATGRTFTTQQVHARMTTFIGGARGSTKRHHLVREITSVLEDLQKWFGNQRRFWFRSSSILVVYNAEYFCETLIENSERCSQSEVDAPRALPNRDLEFSLDGQGSGQTGIIDSELTGKLHEETNEESLVKISGVTVVDSSSSSIENHGSVDQASTQCETSVTARQGGDPTKLVRTYLQTPSSADSLRPENRAREIKSNSDCETFIQLDQKPEASSTSGTVAEGVKDASSSTSDNEIQKKLDVDRLADQRCESKPKKLKLESTSDGSCVNHERDVTESTSNSLIVRVKMIDLAHVLDAGGEPDSGYITGLNNLLQFMRSTV